MALVTCGPNTIPAKTYEEARGRVVNLYRQWIREIPRTVYIYQIDLPVAKLRSAIRSRFETNRNIGDLSVINR